MGAALIAQRATMKPRVRCSTPQSARRPQSLTTTAPARAPLLRARTGGRDESGIVKDSQLRGPVTEGAEQSGGGAVSLPKKAESVALPGDAPVVADDPMTSGPRAEG
eukprot:2406534-Pyramimonas_sp.AAC.1